MNGSLTSIEQGFNYIKKFFGFKLYIGRNREYNTTVIIVHYKKEHVVTYTRIGKSLGMDKTYWSLRLFKKKEYNNV